MPNLSDLTRLSRLLLLAAVVAAAWPVAGARAADEQQEDDEWIDTKIIRNIMQGFGLRRDGEGIEYRERSPLVVPPGRNLPPPETAGAAEANASWPVDPDEKIRREARQGNRASKEIVSEEDDRPLRPAQLNRIPKKKSVAATGGDPDGRPLRPTELGSSKNIWNMFSSGKETEVETFKGEPPRASLITPPQGYQTPSPNFPYGVNTKDAPVKPDNPMDRGMR